MLAHGELLSNILPQNLVERVLVRTLSLVDLNRLVDFRRPEDISLVLRGRPERVCPEISAGRVDLLPVFRSLVDLLIGPVDLDWPEFSTPLDLDWPVFRSPLDLNSSGFVMDMHTIGVNSALQVNNLLFKIRHLRLVNLHLSHQLQVLVLLVSKLAFDLLNLSLRGLRNTDDLDR